jgi:hypothetical protein
VVRLRRRPLAGVLFDNLRTSIFERGGKTPPCGSQRTSSRTCPACPCAPLCTPHRRCRQGL